MRKPLLWDFNFSFAFFPGGYICKRDWLFMSWDIYNHFLMKIMQKEFFSKFNRIVDLGNKNFRTPVQLYHILLFKFA